MGPAAQGGRGVQLHDPPRLEHQHPVRVQDRVEPVWEKVVNGGWGRVEDKALRKKADLLVPPLFPCPAHVCSTDVSPWPEIASDNVLYKGPGEQGAEIHGGLESLEP